MSTLERKEFQETKVLRTVSPTRNYSSSQNLSKFDSNLDCLLEDLQNSVSRPGSSLGYTNAGNESHSYRETSRTIDTGRSNSLNRIANIKSSNPVTEYSSDDTYNYKSPDGRQTVSGYKKEKYMYGKTSSDLTTDKIRAQNSINQLDNLLDDLQQVKNSSFLKTESYNSTGADPNYQSKRSVNRELHYGGSPLRTQTLEREGETIKKDIQYISEGTYKERTARPISPVVNSRTSTLSKQTKVSNIHDYPVEVVETVTPDIDPDVLSHIDPNLRPPGNTKVTTTIKTYTYEIPGAGEFPTNLTLNDSSTNEQKYVYSPNQTITTPSKSFVYNKIENKENTIYKDYPPYQKPTPPGGVLVKETITTRNYQPGYRVDKSPPTTNETYIYNETNTTTNVENGFAAPPPPPPSKQTYLYKESNTSTTKREGPKYPDSYPTGGKETYYIKESHTSSDKNDVPYSERGYPVYNPPDSRNPPGTTYYFKEEHNSSTTNRPGSPYQNGYAPAEPPNKTVIYKHESHTTNNYGPNRPKTPEVETFDPKNPPHPYGFKNKPNEPINIHYSYKSTNQTENNYKGQYPNGNADSLLPRKFPTSDGPDGPPKKLDDLMATIGHEPPTSPLNVGFLHAEQERVQQKKADTLRRNATEVEDLQKKEPAPRTKNVSGPPVYYPPGEMFKKEEAEAAWRAQGGYAKASGKYQYEAESKSKSKSSSGATVVPVCLPLCCGLPCTIL